MHHSRVIFGVKQTSSLPSINTPIPYPADVSLRKGTDMLHNDVRLQTGTIQNSVYAKICTRVVLNFGSYPCCLLAKGRSSCFGVAVQRGTHATLIQRAYHPFDIPLEIVRSSNRNGQIAALPRSYGVG